MNWSQIMKKKSELKKEIKKLRIQMQEMLKYQKWKKDEEDE